MRVATFALVVSLSVSCAMLPRPGKPSMPDVQFRMREFRLQNGMRVIVEEDHASPLVGVFTVVGVGSSGDPQGKEGLAHLVEHLAFRARPWGGPTAWNQLEGAGIGMLNAFTNLDDTTYFEVGTRDLLPKLLAIDMARLTDPLAGIDERVFDVEREVVRNELRQRGENAIGPAFNFLQEAVFPPGHRYARPIGGSHESLTAITLEDAKHFTATHYLPANMTLLVVGDVDLATVQTVLANSLPPGFFRPLPPTKEPFKSRMAAESAPPPEPPPTKLIRKHSTVASPELYVVWSLPRSFDADTVLLDFVSAAANRELSAAFFSDPDIVDVGVFPVPGVEASMLVAQATLRKGEHPEKSMERLLDQLVNIWMTDQDFQSDVRMLVASDRAFGRSRNQAVMQMTFGAESLFSRGVERAESTHFTGDPLTYSRRLRALIDVNEAQVKHFAEKYLRRDRARAVLVEPFPPEAKATAAGALGLKPAEPDAQAPTFAPSAVKALGRAHEARELETVVHGTRTQAVETLPNGLEVVLHRRRNALPLVVAELTFPTGSAMASPPGAAELGSLVASPKGRAWGVPGDFGISFRTGIDTDVTTVSGSCASGNVPNLLAQLSERVTSMHVETAELEYFKAEFADYFEKTEELPQARASRALRAALFAGHPYGTTHGAADWRKLSAGDVEGWYARAFSPKGAVLVVAGDIDVDQTMAWVKQFLGGWSAPSDGLTPAPRVPLRQGAPTVVVTNQPNATQAQVTVACLAAGQSVREELANDMTATLLGTALFDKVRGELGASYGFGGSASPLLGGVSRLTWTGAVENERLGKALKVLRTLTDEFETKTLTETAIGRARWEVARGSTLEDSTAGATAAGLTHRVLRGRDVEKKTSTFELLSGLGKAELEAAWKDCRGSVVLSLMGDEARIREALKEAGY